MKLRFVDDDQTNQALKVFAYPDETNTSNKLTISTLDHPLCECEQAGACQGYMMLMLIRLMELSNIVSHRMHFSGLLGGA